ncbi:2-dehydro-3-deoxy-6-phosphogalactonate aldolase [uncultured Maritalea sp.]|jgi:2-dehydro-3-deoxyphosphogalactonate aldolase|uniref:2-dehydro-3-deoxy-6-phosphogalactonate aldolase n=1 Tax=uncultured Maritalea sp. TaxID=757249 RepID=UPI002636E9EA|nr:2-dehydro-3-deoxy-6-phosphogalactonate aldolase [uncultured Maritalea sp.]
MARKIIAILRGIKPEEAVALTREIIDAGITLIEVPLNSPQPFDSISAMRHAFDGVAQIGAGTVLTLADVAALKAADGQFVVSPDCNVEVIKATKAAGMNSYPGVFTATECFAAIHAGADGLKLFPASVLGTSGLKALRAVLPSTIDAYAVGGAGPDNFDQWHTAGANGFGIGTAIYKPGDDAATVRAKADAIVAAYDKVFG